jgi:CPA2 family monovalent cation:H+ antiporter-2
MALGAFLAGMVVGQSEFSYRAASEALPMRDAFAVLFFVSVGLLFDPAHVARAPVQIAITTAIVMAAKPLAALLVTMLLGYGARVSFRVAIALAQIGEFSFILSGLGNRLGLLPAGAGDSLVAASIVSITFNPLLYGSTPWIERRLISMRFLGRLFRARVAAVEPGSANAADVARLHAVVVGYGPVGRSVAKLLEFRGTEPAVIELNPETVRQLQSAGKRAVHGDAMRRDILAEAGAASATALIVTSPAGADETGIIRTARELNPSIRVLARSAYVAQAAALRDAGADEVFSGEAEVAIAMIQHLLGALGTTPEQMDRERERVRTELYGG